MEIIIIILGIGLVGTGGLSFRLFKSLSEEKLKREKEINELKNIPEEKQLELVGTKAKEILLSAEKRALEMQADMDHKVQSTRDELATLEKRLISREEAIDKRSAALEEKEEKLESRLT